MTKKHKHKKPHVLGVIKGRHIATIKVHPAIQPLVLTEESPAHDFLPEEEHVVVAVPKSTWSKIVDWLNGSYGE